jgi:hypothetical protein
MKKIISILLLSLSITGYAQEVKSVQDDFSKEVLEANQKSIDYKLRVLKGHDTIYNSEFSTRNSQIIPVFYNEDNTSSEEMNENSKGYSPETIQSISEAKKSELHNNFQLRLAVHLSKNSNNMWSNFYIQELVANKTQKAMKGSAVLDGSPVKGVAINTAPETSKSEKELLVAHKNGVESTLSWHDYTFVFTAKIE